MNFEAPAVSTWEGELATAERNLESDLGSDITSVLREAHEESINNLVGIKASLERAKAETEKTANALRQDSLRSIDLAEGYGVDPEVIRALRSDVAGWSGKSSANFLAPVGRVVAKLFQAIREKIHG